MKKQHLVLAFGLGLAAAFAVACENKTKSDQGGGGNSAPTTAADTAKAQAIYQERCSLCHGANGRGDGPGAAALNPKPRNYTDKNWQAAVTDDQIKKTITYGGAAVGKSPIMPASPDLEQKPEVVDGLVKIVRKFGS